MKGEGWRLIQTQSLFVVELPVSFHDVQEVMSGYGLEMQLEVAIDLVQRTQRVFKDQLQTELYRQALRMSVEEES